MKIHNFALLKGKLHTVSFKIILRMYSIYFFVNKGWSVSLDELI